MKQLPANYLLMQQGSAEWLAERCGQVTASRIADVMATVKKGESAKRSGYKMELLAEIVTGDTADHYVSPAMDYGIEYEPVARAAYEMAQGVEVQSIGYVRHPNIPRSGASPDGLVGDDGLVEIKVPTTRTHLEYFLAGAVPAEYKPQMLWQMACSGRQWCDFVSYDPRLPEEFGLLIVRFERDEEAITEMEESVRTFIGELNAMADGLLARKREVKPKPFAPVPAVIPEWSDV